MKKSVSLMFSGGLDSYIAYYYAIKNDFEPICIYVDFKHEYNKKERKVIEDLKIPINFIDINGLWELISKRLKNQIIPSRNVLLAVIGSMVSDRVWINALEGEQLGKERDKSEKFFNLTSELLSYTNNFFQETTIIESPFKDLLKSETIKLALNELNLTKEELFKTSSCYHSEYEKCGVCLTCVKRYLAFLANDIEEPGYKSNPLDSEYFKELTIEIPKAKKNNDFSRFTQRRIEEFLRLMKKLNINV